MPIDEHPNIQKEDWRLQAITTLAKEWTSPWTGTKHDKGAAVTAISTIKFGNKILLLKLPNVTALFLDFSYKLWIDTQNEIENEGNFLKFSSKYIPNNNVYPASDDKVFNFIEKRMASIVFAYSALESFANENIPDNYIFQKQRDDDKCVEKYHKKQIERFLNLDLKLSEILPNIMNVTNPKGTNVWNRYKNLQQIRDSIIHMKSKDRKSSGPEEESIWNNLLEKSNPNFAFEAKEIIGYYLPDETKQPRWFRKFPY